MAIACSVVSAVLRLVLRHLGVYFPAYCAARPFWRSLGRPAVWTLVPCWVACGQDFRSLVCAYSGALAGSASSLRRLLHCRVFSLFLVVYCPSYFPLEPDSRRSSEKSRRTDRSHSDSAPIAPSDHRRTVARSDSPPKSGRATSLGIANRVATVFVDVYAEHPATGLLPIPRQIPHASYIGSAANLYRPH